MSAEPPPPPPPQVSPDGKFYWDGTRWVPMPAAAAPEPPQPRQLSPDEKYYWDGERWVPVALMDEEWIAPVVPVPTTPKKGHALRNVSLGCIGLIVLLIIISIAALGAINTSVSISPSSPTVSNAVCVGDPHAHVYSPDRLQVIAACVELTGTIDSEVAQPDGDYHVRLHLDPGQTCAGQLCINAQNVSDQAGDLILEPVCENPITQADAVEACQDYHNPLVLPPLNSHVKVTGPFVLDTDHGWNEIHPLESITIVPTSTPEESPIPSPTPSAAPAKLTVKITASTYGNVAATTLPGASCKAKAKLPSGRISTAAGLSVVVVAGDDGGVSWSYRTVSSTKPGTGTHTVTCVLAGKTVSASAPFTVA